MTLELHKVSENYFDRLFVSKNNSALSSAIKAKVLLVDKYTTPIISMCYTQSQLLQHDVILVELMDNQHSLNTMKHLNCIVYIKPTKESIVMLTNELRNPHFNSYQLFFNNMIHKSQLEKIADADEFEVINQVVEVFQDYLICNNNLFQINLANNLELSAESNSNPVVVEADSLSSLLLSLKKCPVIKFESNSLQLRKLSSEILYNINSNSNNNLYDDLNRNSDVPPVLLLLDRQNDPITPLLTPWTYQSMLHELIGISKNIIDLNSKEQILLSESQDTFFRESMYLNYGDLTDKFQKFVEDYKKQTKLSSIDNLKTQNLNELKQLLTKFPEFKKLSNNILKHLNLITELDTQIAKQNLWDIGELQQTIICDLENHLAIKEKLNIIFDSAEISTTHKIKLLLLYELKFSEHGNDISLLISKLSNPSLTQPPPTLSQLTLVKKFNELFGSKNLKSTDNNTNNIGNIFNKNKININQLFSSGSKSAPKTDNIYMQYIPKLNEILNNLTNQQAKQQGKVPHNQPSELSTIIPDTVTNRYGQIPDDTAVQDVIIYFKGGVTYEESRLVHELSATNPRLNLIIGSDKIINSEMWLESLYDIVNDSSSVANAPRRENIRDFL